jgi:hypothetical protein
MTLAASMVALAASMVAHQAGRSPSWWWPPHCSAYSSSCLHSEDERAIPDTDAPIRDFTRRVYEGRSGNLPYLRDIFCGKMRPGSSVQDHAQLFG